MLEIVFWSLAALVAYHHAFFPILLGRIAPRMGEPSPPRAVPADSLPSVTLLIPVFNEERHLPEKLACVEQLDYPRDRLRVVFAFDGCTDRSVEIFQASGAADRGIGSVTYEKNLGKVHVLNAQIASAQTELVALSDVSAVFDPDLLRRAAAHFHDPGVGVVCPSYHFRPADTTSVEGAYWDYQRRIKADEARVGAPMGAHGAFYMFRRRHWEPLPLNTINDDFVLPMRIVAKGCQAVYDGDLRVTELEPSSPQQDFRRRMRIGAGNLQQTLWLAKLAQPKQWGVAFVFLSGKALRAFMPPILLLCGVSFGMLVADGRPSFQLAGAVLTLMLIGLGIASASGSRPARSMVRSLFYAGVGYLAAGLGMLIYVAGGSPYLWRLSRLSWLGRASRVRRTRDA